MDLSSNILDENDLRREILCFRCRKYYEKSALMLDAVKGGVVAALLG